MSDPLLAEHRDRVLVLTLNRPEARNALNAVLVDELVGRLQHADDDQGVGSVVLTGADPVFCSGADLKEMSGTEDPGSMVERISQSVRMYSMIAGMRTPVIAAVNGHALAGGCGLAMACDLVVAAEHAEFGYPEIQRGLIAAIVMVSLRRLVSQREALDLLLTGRRVTASEAKSIGMVNAVVPGPHVMVTAHRLAEDIASRDPTIVGLTKELFYGLADLPRHDAFERAAATNLIVRLMRTQGPGEAFQVGRS